MHALNTVSKLSAHVRCHHKTFTFAISSSHELMLK